MAVQQVRETYNLTALAWTPIIAPINSVGFSVHNTDTAINVLSRTDPNNSDTQDTLEPQAQEISPPIRFVKGDTAGFYQAASATVTIKVVWNP